MTPRGQFGFVTISFAIAIVVGCTGTTNPGVSRRLALATAEARWNAAGLHDYSYDEVIGGSWFGDSLHVDVRADTVAASYSYRNSSVHLNAMTITGMFAEIRTDLDAGTIESASYDGTLGFPAHVTGSQHGVPDTGYGFGAVNVTPVPAP